MGKASAVMQALQYLVIMKRELSKNKALSFRPILTYGHESWVMTERIRLQVQAFKMRFLRRIEGVTLFNKVCSSKIRKSLNIEPLLLRIERPQLRWLGHVSRMPQERLSQTSFTCESKREKASGTTMNTLGRLQLRILDGTGWDFNQVKCWWWWRLNLELLPPQPSRT